jgi:hypothetical protein
MKRINPVTLMTRRELPETISPPEEFTRLIELERLRVSRHHHRFSVVVFDLGPPDKNRLALRNLVKRLVARVRDIDQVGWYDRRRIGVLLPYTPIEGAQKLAESICAVTEPGGREPVCTLYTYPTEEAVIPEFELAAAGMIKRA